MAQTSPKRSQAETYSGRDCGDSCRARREERKACTGKRRADSGELREYGIGAQILADLGVHEMELLTNSHHNVVGLEGYGITVTGERPIPE